MPTGSKAPAPPGWLRVAFEGTNGGTDWAVVHWFLTEPTTDPTQPELNDLVDAIADAFGTEFISSSSVGTDTHFTRVVARYSMASAPDVMKTVRVVDVVGTNGGTIESGQVCYLINWQTADGRRGGKARSYIPGVASQWMDDQAHISSAQVTSRTGAANAYHNAVNALSSAPWSAIHFIDASFVDAKAYRLTPRAYEIFSGNCSAVVATQRRRVDRLRV